ncbi:YciI family protein [Pseudoduganella sp. GCM10020061]|uniref:YciI family protein n=1 Tax=Pseudoduganella sp. GCM10020061 TaxID=3317345 RepID=UPI00363BCC56
MFIVSLTYKDIGKVDALLGAHRDFLREQYGRGIFLMSGPKRPRTGGIIIANAETREELDAAIALDPFYQAGVAEYEITEFAVNASSDALAPFRED